MLLLLCFLLHVYNANSSLPSVSAEISRKIRLMHPKLREFAVAVCSRDSCDQLPPSQLKQRESCVNTSPGALPVMLHAEMAKRHNVGPLHTFTPMPEAFAPLERMVLMANGNLQRLMRLVLEKHCRRVQLVCCVSVQQVAHTLSIVNFVDDT